MAELLDMDAADIMEIFYRNSRFEFVKEDRRELGAKVRKYVVEEMGVLNIYIDRIQNATIPTAAWRPMSLALQELTTRDWPG